jgi:hypothetical protein
VGDSLKIKGDKKELRRGGKKEGEKELREKKWRRKKMIEFACTNLSMV